MLRRTECSYCGLPHHVIREYSGAWICGICDYLELVRAESFDLKEALSYLRRHSLCAYCGEYASDVEHVIPKITALPTLTVPACRECNILAGKRVFSCFEHKKEFIQDKLKTRYRKLLSLPEWDAEEIAEMGPGLRRYIEESQIFREQVKQRVEWSWLVALLDKSP
jgi:ribosomal protein S27AE